VDFIKKPVFKFGLILVLLGLVAMVFLLKQAADSDSPSESRQAGRNLEAVYPLHVTEAFDLEALRATGLPLLIDFGADSCIPCKEMAPILEELHAELAGKAIILFVDVWKYRQLGANLPIRAIPTQLLFDASGKPFSPPEDFSLRLLRYNSRENREHIFTAHEGGLSREQLLQLLQAMGLKL